MPTLIVIPNWDRDFENSKSRQVERTTFFCVQNHFDGKKIRRLQNLRKKALELYGAFHAICGIASKCWYRGVLLDADGPISAVDLAAKTGFDVKQLGDAIKELSKPGIALLELYDIDHQGGEWVLPEAVKRWAIPQDRRRTLKTSDDSSRPVAARRGPGQPQVSAKHAPSVAATVELPGPAEDARGPSRPAEPAKAPVGKGREGNNPLPSPAGGPPAGNLITNPDIAKRMICEKILGGKDPSRAWSHQAMFRLSELCSPPGMPLQEILDVAEWRAIPKTDDIPELKFRIEPVTETGLMSYWGDEVERARAYLKKYRRNGSVSEKKPEPKLWQEFFRWKYGDDCQLPASFALLDDDQKKEWQDEHEKWEGSTACNPAVEALRS